jgi:hypothetical protein
LRHKRQQSLVSALPSRNTATAQAVQHLCCLCHI